MKSIVFKKLYNTDTAKVIATWKYDPVRYDEYALRFCEFLYEKQTLYKKANGEFFLHAEGDNFYNLMDDDENVRHINVSIIIPLDEFETKEWLADFGFVDEYIELFGEPEE